LPYALKYLEVSNFQGITKELKIGDDTNNDIAQARLIFFTGENGFGKTSILKAIAIGLTGDEFSYLNSNINYENLIKAYQKNELYEYDFSKNEENKNNEFKIVAYGLSRSVPNKNSTAANNRTNRIASLFDYEALLSDIESVLINAYREKENEIKAGVRKEATLYAQFTTILKKVIPNISNIEVNYNPKLELDKRYSVLYYEREYNFDDNKNGVKLQNIKEYEAVKLDDLATGYRSILTMIGDMVIRLSNNFKNPIDEISGVVIIDEIDAYLHPKYQYEIPKLLTETFPKVQFIVSTHSPIPILGKPKDIKSVVYKVNRTIEDGITVERLDDDMDIRRLNPNALLTSPIFGFEHLLARDAKPEDITPIDNFKEWEDIWEDFENLKKEGKI
jgi:predicted ATP-dependent endonuclease of OLD family